MTGYRKLPAKLGACIDLAYELREKRLSRQREVEAELAEMKADEKALKDHIINTFTKSEIDGAKGSVCSASITRVVYPKVTDWDKVYAYILKTKEFDLLEKRMGKLAFRERYDSGVKIPGTEAYEDVDLSLTKLNK